MKLKKIPNYSSYLISFDGKILSTKSKRWLTPCPNSSGYLEVKLYKNKLKHSKLIHRLILETFVGKCPKGYVACHIDGNKLNNHIYNLRWDTIKNNHADAIKHGTHPGFKKRGEHHHNSKLTEGDIRYIKELFKSGMFQKDIGKLYNIGQDQVSRIVNGKSWSYLYETV